MAETWTIETGPSTAGPKYIRVVATVTDVATVPPTVHTHILNAALVDTDLKPKADIQASLVDKLQDMHRETLAEAATAVAAEAEMEAQWKVPLQTALDAKSAELGVK